MREAGGEPPNSFPMDSAEHPSRKTARSGVVSTDPLTVNTRFVDVTSGPATTSFAEPIFAPESSSGLFIHSSLGPGPRLNVFPITYTGAENHDLPMLDVRNATLLSG
jgi:hypothetical protein